MTPGAHTKKVGRGVPAEPRLTRRVRPTAWRPTLHAPHSTLLPLLLFTLLTSLFTLPLPAQPAVTANAPVKNFRLPQLNAEGVRTSILRGAEARYISTTQIDLVDMQYTTFLADGSNRVETTLLAPVATVHNRKNDFNVQGADAVRLIRNDLEVTGKNWTYDHTGKKITIASNVRVTFHAELKAILK